MAGRPNKVGLDYFELDCHVDEKIELIEAEFGLKGFAIIVKLYQSIYAGFGYYCEWNPDLSVLFARRLGLSSSVEFGSVGNVCEECALPGFPKNLINEVISASIRRNIFSEELFRKYSILTSTGIQKRYLNATSKRGNVELIKEYLLISVDKNANNVSINSINVVINSNNIVNNEQSKGKESKVYKKHIVHSDEVHGTNSDTLELFYESIWKLYPLKKGKGQVLKATRKRLLEIGFDEIARAIDRYKADLEKDSWRKPQNGSTFFNSGYVDYLDANYQPGKEKTILNNTKQNLFHSFPQRVYSQEEYDEMERSLLNRGSGI
ncbi:MAG: DUF4373 domain-containing protein [Acetivibrio sp.]